MLWISYSYSRNHSIPLCVAIFRITTHKLVAIRFVRAKDMSEIRCIATQKEGAGASMRGHRDNALLEKFHEARKLTRKKVMEVLTKYRIVAIVGVSRNPTKYSFKVAE